MKMFKMLLTSVVIVITSSVFCQENNKPLKKKMRITDAYILPGVGFQRDPYVTKSDFQKIAPQSALLNQNTEDYHSSSWRSFSGNAIACLNIGINFLNKEKTEYNSNPQLRIGLVYISGSNLSSSLYQNDRKRFDTITFSQTGTIYYDSVISRHYNMDYHTEQLRLDASLIYRTNPAARWSLYGGIGIEAGASINTYTQISYSEYTRIESRDNYGYNSISSHEVSSFHQSEDFKHKSSYGGSVYLPIGLDFRISRKWDFFKRLHVFYEMRPSLNMAIIPELGTIANVGSKQMLGLRVSF